MFGLSTNQLIIIASILLLVVVVFIILLTSKRKKKPITPELDVEQLLIALGGSSNLDHLSREHQRLKVMVKDLKKVQQPLLKTLNIPAFLKGKELTLLIKHQTSHVLSYLSERQKERT